MNTLEKLEQDYKKSLQEKNEKVVGTLRLIKAALQNKEIDLHSKKDKLKEEDIVEVLQREAKKRRESMEMFKKGGREDLVSQEQEELNIISKYLPKQLSEEELKKIIHKIIQPLGELTVKDFGRVMNLVMKETKGKTEGNTVSRIVKEIIGK